MRAENRELKSKGTAGQLQAGSTASTVSSEESTVDKKTRADWRAAGQQFALLADLWPQREILKRPCPPRLRLLKPWDSGRCANDTAWDQGNVAELYQILPERYHELIEHSKLFATSVSDPSKPTSMSLTL